jgi:hypothetical protein
MQASMAEANDRGGPKIFIKPGHTVSPANFSSKYS